MMEANRQPSAVSRQLEKLISELEAAKEGSRELDFKMGAYFGWKPPTIEGANPEWAMWLAPDGDQNQLPWWTTSLDAALTLVPEGTHWDISNHGCHEGHEDEDGVWHIDTVIPLAGIHGKKYCSSRAATPALALCIAALKAKMAIKGEKNAPA